MAFHSGALLAAIFLSATPALAFGAGGYLTLEGRAFHAPAFALVDANGDAAISRAEFDDWFVADDPADDAFAACDTDGDGRISAEEFADLLFEDDPQNV